MRRPLIPNRRAAKLIAFGGLAVALLAFYDAYDGRGGKAPIWIRWALPF